MWYEIDNDLIFPSPGLMATVVAGESKDGWNWVSAADRTLTLRNAWALAETGPTILECYEPPNPAIRLT
jgi:hypothetical protein